MHRALKPGGCDSLHRRQQPGDYGVVPFFFTFGFIFFQCTCGRQDTAEYTEYSAIKNALFLDVLLQVNAFHSNPNLFYTAFTLRLMGAMCVACSRPCLNMLAGWERSTRAFAFLKPVFPSLSRDRCQKKYIFGSKKSYSRIKKQLSRIKKKLKPSTERKESSVLWSSGPLVPSSSGPLVLWSPGPLVPSSSGPLVLWSPGPLLWSPGPLVPWSSGPLVPWSSGPLVSGPLVLWSPGPLVRWSALLPLNVIAFSNLHLHQHYSAKSHHRLLPRFQIYICTSAKTTAACFPPM